MSKTNNEAVAYIRMSTEGQSQNGVGVQRQRVAIEHYARQTGMRISNWLEEIASGRGADNLQRRPLLQEAIAIARRRGIPIIVTELSRLSRESKTLEEIVQQGVKIISATEGQLDEVTFGARAASAQAVGQRISETTRQGLQTRKAQGVKFGNPKNLPEAQKKGAAKNKQRGELKVKEIADALRDHPAGESITAKEAADYLNTLGIKTGRNAVWTIAAIRRPLGAALDLLRQLREDRYKAHPLYGRF